MSAERPLTLGVDVGGTGIKAALLDRRGRMITQRLRVRTPYPFHPDILLDIAADLAGRSGSFDRISVGFPGVVRGGRILTAPHFGNEIWHGFDLAAALEKRFGKPTRILNDAEVQGLGIIEGKGLEVVLTLGTGLGSAIFSHGGLAPHLELAHHPLRKHKTYDDYLGDAARHAIGRKKWNKRLCKVIGIVQRLLNYDVLYLGGGNAANIAFEPPANVRIASNDAGITGGIRLWDETVWRTVPRTNGEARPRRKAGA